MVSCLKSSKKVRRKKKKRLSQFRFVWLCLSRHSEIRRGNTMDFMDFLRIFYVCRISRFLGNELVGVLYAKAT